MLESEIPLKLVFGQDHSDRLSVFDINGRLVVKSLSHLSLGQMSVLNLLLSIMRFGDQTVLPEQISGLIIIDEIDTHLTGNFKSKIIPWIIRLFPNVQFIITTHDAVSVVGFENSGAIDIVELPTGNKLLARDYREIESIRRGLKTLNQDLLSMVERIKNSSKPILLVEDRYTELYKVAWMKLHIVSFDEDTFQSVFDRESPFDIVSANGSQNLYFFLNMAHIPFEIEDRKVVGLFDFDDAFNSFQGLDSNEWGEIIGSDSDGWYRKRKSTRNYSAMVLPVPGFRSDLASRNYGGNTQWCLSP